MPAARFREIPTWLKAGVLVAFAVVLALGVGLVIAGHDVAGGAFCLLSFVALTIPWWKGIRAKWREAEVAIPIEAPAGQLADRVRDVTEQQLPEPTDEPRSSLPRSDPPHQPPADTEPEQD